MPVGKSHRLWLAVTVALFGGAAAAQCSDCERPHALCVKGCFTDSSCRRACEKEFNGCLAECTPEERKRVGAAVSISALETQCSSGDEKACYSLGAIYFRGRELAADYEKASKFLEVSCRDGHADACGMLGEIYLHPYGVPQDVTRGLSLMEKSCDRGSAEGCTALGRVLREGKHKAKDLERAMKLWKDACAKSDGEACTLLGLAHLDEKHEAALALEKFDLGCTLGDGPGCAALCGMLQGDQGVPRDEKRALKTCEKGCADGNYLSCARQGRLLWYGDEVKPDPKKGRDLLDTACEGGDAMACAELGEAMEAGSHGVKKDAEAAKGNFLRAARRLEKECNERLEVRPCALWGTLVARGKVPQKDAVRVKSMLEKGCTPEASLGCFGLGLVQEDAREPQKALEAFARGCAAEQGAACFGQGRLLEAEDPAKAQVAFEKGCARADAASCLKLGERLKADKAPAKAVKAMRAKACRYGAVDGCK